MAHIKALQQELDSLQKCYDVTNVDWKRMAQENQSLRQDIAKLHGIDGVPYIGGLIVDAVIQYVKQLQQENDIFRTDLDDANVQMAYRDKVIGELQAQNGAYRQTLDKVMEIFKRIEYMQGDENDCGICPYCKNYPHLQGCCIGETIKAIDKVVTGE